MNWQELLKDKLELSLMPEIPNMALYAQAWSYLAADFEAIGFTRNAEYCRARWRQYRDLDPGAYRRLVEGSFVELKPVPLEELLYESMPQLQSGD